MRRAAKVDANQSEIVSALRRVDANVLIVSQLKNAFDILVGFRDELFIMEIKDGTKPPSQRYLTDGEMQCKNNFERVGVPYYVVNSINEALKVIGAI